MNIDEVVKQYLPSAPEERIQSGTERVLNELRARPYVVRERLVQPRRFGQVRFAMIFAAMAVVAVSAIIWREGPPFSAVKTGVADDHSMGKSSSQQDGDPLKITVPSDAFEVASVKL